VHWNGAAISVNVRHQGIAPAAFVGMGEPGKRSEVVAGDIRASELSAAGRSLQHVAKLQAWVDFSTPNAEELWFGNWAHWS
jgi:hypothetical protein